jgi:hypothetical protein
MKLTYPVYGYLDRLKPRHLAPDKLMRVEPGVPGRVVRSGTDDRGVPYSLVDFDGVFVYISREDA